jgi:hypothetical protein
MYQAASCKDANLPAQMIKNILQANQRLQRFLFAMIMCFLEIDSDVTKLRKSSEKRKFIADREWRMGLLTRQARQNAQQLLTAMRTLPEQEPWTSIRGGLEDTSRQQGQGR